MVGSMTWVLFLLSFGLVRTFNFCVHKGVTHPLNTVFADHCNRCMCREWGVDTAVCTDIKCNKLVLNAPGCTHNCLASKHDVQLHNSLEKLFRKSGNLDTLDSLAEETLPQLGDQAHRYLVESSASGDDAITEPEQGSESSILGDQPLDPPDEVKQSGGKVQDEDVSSRMREGVKGGGRRGRIALKQQLDKLMLGKKRRAARFSV